MGTPLSFLQPASAFTPPSVHLFVFSLAAAAAAAIVVRQFPRRRRQFVRHFSRRRRRRPAAAAAAVRQPRRPQTKATKHINEAGQHGLPATKRNRKLSVTGDPPSNYWSIFKSRL